MSRPPTAPAPLGHPPLATSAGVVLVPFGYHPASSKAERDTRLNAVKARTQQRMALRLQKWWRSVLERREAARHARVVRQLIVLNAKATFIQRWWRIVSAIDGTSSGATGTSGDVGSVKRTRLRRGGASAATATDRSSRLPPAVQLRRIDVDDCTAAADRLVNGLERCIRREALRTAMLTTWHQAIASDDRSATAGKQMKAAHSGGAPMRPPSVQKQRPEVVAPLSNEPPSMAAAWREHCAHSTGGGAFPLTRTAVKGRGAPRH